MNLNQTLLFFYILVFLLPFAIKLVHSHTDLDTRGVPIAYAALSVLMLGLLLRAEPKLLIGFVLFTLIAVFATTLVLFEVTHLNLLAAIFLIVATLSYLLGVTVLGEFSAGLFLMTIIVLVCRHTVIYED